VSFAWQPQFELGVERLDTEHREIVKLVAAVAERVRNGARTQDVAAAVRELAL